MNAGNSGQTHQRSVCESTISEVLMEPESMNTVTSDRPIASSYEIT